MRRVAIVFAGGFGGALARYLMSPLVLLLAARLAAPGAGGGFPYDILLINLSGALALGFLYGLFEAGARLPADLRLLLGTGFLGAYTTFSSFATGGYTLVMSGALLAGLCYLFGSLLFGALCADGGYRLAALLLRRRRRAAATTPNAEYDAATSTEFALGLEPDLEERPFAADVTPGGRD